MLIEGNHEIEPQAAGVTFKSYLSRFAVPSAESDSKSNFYYSFDAGGIHIIMLGAYVDYDRTSEFWLFCDSSILINLMTRVSLFHCRCSVFLACETLAKSQPESNSLVGCCMASSVV